MKTKCLIFHYNSFSLDFVDQKEGHANKPWIQCGSLLTGGIKINWIHS